MVEQWNLRLANKQKVEEVPATGKFNMGISVIMRVVLRDGTYHEVFFTQTLHL